MDEHKKIRKKLEKHGYRDETIGKIIEFYTKPGRDPDTTVICPKCENEIAKPKKNIENRMFRLAYYTCDNCGTSFTVSY